MADITVKQIYGILQIIEHLNWQKKSKIISFINGVCRRITSASSGKWTLWALAKSVGFAILQFKPRYGEKFTAIAPFLAVFSGQLLLVLAPLFAYIPFPLKRQNVIRAYFISRSYLFLLRCI